MPIIKKSADQIQREANKGFALQLSGGSAIKRFIHSIINPGVNRQGLTITRSANPAADRMNGSIKKLGAK